MSNIVVLVKQVPDTYSERKLTDDDFTLDRENADAVLDEINENAVEAALQLKEAGGDRNVVVLSVGPASAKDALRKALSSVRTRPSSSPTMPWQAPMLSVPPGPCRTR